ISSKAISTPRFESTPSAVSGPDITQYPPMTIGASFGISITPRSSVTGPLVSAWIAGETNDKKAAAATAVMPHELFVMDQTPPWLPQTLLKWRRRAGHLGLIYCVKRFQDASPAGTIATL